MYKIGETASLRSRYTRWDVRASRHASLKMVCVSAGMLVPWLGPGPQQPSAQQAGALGAQAPAMLPMRDPGQGNADGFSWPSARRGWQGHSDCIVSEKLSVQERVRQAPGQPQQLQPAERRRPLQPHCLFATWESEAGASGQWDKLRHVSGRCVRGLVQLQSQ